VYFRALTKNQAHELVLAYFLQCAKRDGLTKADLARRLGRRPEQITRWFSAPRNWTLDTVSDLLTAMEAKLNLDAVPFSELRTANECHEMAEAPRYAGVASPPDPEDEGQDAATRSGASVVRVTSRSDHYENAEA
jgi:DNA-binding phage protein